MYDQGTQAVSRRRSVRTYPSGRSGRRTGHSQEQVRLAQLVVCFVLFLTIFLWKGIFPQKLVQVRDDVLNLISTDFNFQEALSNLGESLAGSETVLSDLGEFCIEVFGTAPQGPRRRSRRKRYPFSLRSPAICWLRSCNSSAAGQAWRHAPPITRISPPLDWRLRSRKNRPSRRFPRRLRRQQSRRSLPPSLQRER